MASQVQIPKHVVFAGDWAVTVHPFSSTDGGVPGEPEIEILIASRSDGGEQALLGFMAVPYGTLDIQRGLPQLQVVDSSAANWATDFILSVRNSKPINPKVIYEIFSKVVAKSLLSGHLVALKFSAILTQHADLKQLDFAGRWDKEFRLLVGQPDQSLTSFTALNYKLLTDWLESSPAQVLADVEGVPATTIRNRIHAARELGVIGKPGSGKRSTKSSTK
jgi:hypothetical protein